MRRILLAIVTFWIAIVDLDASGKWITPEGCQLISNSSNDGDSFHVRAKGRHYVFRLCFVDAPETDAEFRERVEEQSKYFGVTVEQIVKVGKAAKSFVGEKLATPFTVRTCRQDALGRSKLERFYALVQAKEGDLGEQLIENGLARIHGASANPVGLPRANVEWQKLQGLERAARLEKVGGWGVNYGRMLARSVSSKNRVPVDLFEAFFHPERAQGDHAMPCLRLAAAPGRSQVRHQSQDRQSKVQ
jgi:endonuclease YncB( thermonuclease family)